MCLTEHSPFNLLDIYGWAPLRNNIVTPVVSFDVNEIQCSSGKFLDLDSATRKLSQLSCGQIAYSTWKCFLPVTNSSNVSSQEICKKSPVLSQLLKRQPSRKIVVPVPKLTIPSDVERRKNKYSEPKTEFRAAKRARTSSVQETNERREYRKILRPRKTRKGNSDDVYVVAKILARRPLRNKKKRLLERDYEYLIRWKGFGADGDTWEPFANLIDCPLKLQEFRNKMNKKKQRKQF
jgi:Chromo (CHRromatin Organisation MOdifier) domain